MDQPRPNPWVAVTLAAMAILVLLFVWSAWRGGGEVADVARSAARSAPHLRPRLPEAPHLPDAPILPK